MVVPQNIPTITPEYAAEDSSGPLRRIAFAFIVLETLTIIAYFVSRYIKQPTIHREMPYLMVLGYIFSVGIPIMSLVIIYTAGAGHHIYVVPAPLRTRRFKIDKAMEWTYLPAVTFPKLAILSLYMKLFTVHSKRLRYICYATGASIIILFVYGLIAPAVSCRPFAYNWDKTIKGGHCFDILASYRWVSFPNIITDLVMMALCVPAIYKLQVPLGTKISLALTFMLGSVGIITSIIRFAEFFKNEIFTDHTYNGSSTMIWTTVEPGVYFMAAALLTMRPLFRWVFKDVKMPSYLLKITTMGSWSRKSSKNSKTSYGDMQKDENIALEYSDSTKNLTVHETALNSTNRSVDRDGFRRLEEGRNAPEGRIAATTTTTTRTSYEGDPWLTTALR